MKHVLVFSIVLFTLASCKQHTVNVERAFYFWKSNAWNFTDKEKALCDSLGIQKLYVKFFEVDYNPEMGSYPVSKSGLGEYGIRETKIGSIVPTVYLRNVVFLKSSKAELDELADNINFLINKRTKEQFPESATIEWQMDCDWTLNSKDNYFYFLQKLKSLSGKKISCTLRLYPYKYRDKMGVPPVDKVTLMCYNLLSPLDNPGKNSILDLKELKSYMNGGGKYPLHMDVALPVYSWAQVYHNERFSSVLYASEQTIMRVLAQQKPLWYRVTKDTMINETYLRVGDQIKYEKMNASAIKEAIGMLKKYVSFDNEATVTLFHLDEEQLNQFTNEELSSFYTDFSH